MIVVSGHFRLPPDRIDEAREADARGYRGVAPRTWLAAPIPTPKTSRTPGLFRVYEEWDDRAALEAHFATAHMLRWQKEREALGFHDRKISIREAGEADPF